MSGFQLLPEHESAGAFPESLRELLSKKAEAFGKFPDTPNWFPGDLILIRAATTSKSSIAVAMEKPVPIEKAQRAYGYPPNAARWTHAAIYIGDYTSLCEAIPSGVTLNDISKYCTSKYALLVRRPREVRADRDKGWRMAVHAIKHLYQRYDYRYLAEIAAQKMLTDSGRPVRFSKSTKICSTLYADAYASVMRRPLRDKDSGVCVPAFLSQCDQLEDVQINWLKV
jgi:hypothetical protein